MKVKKWSKGLVISIVISAVLLGSSAYAATCEVTTPGTVANQSFAPLIVAEPMFGTKPLFVQPVQAGAVIMEWNQEAARLTLLTSSNLAPVQQARVMAIVQVAVHDAVNGITRDYETYLSPGPAPENARSEERRVGND